MHPRVIAIIQARMASSRLPGKVLLDIAGRPMLARVVARTSRTVMVQEVLVATTNDDSDDPVVGYCRANNIPCFRGSQFDVLDRYYQAARERSAEVVVRITADCPVIDPNLIDDTVDVLFGRAGEAARNQAEPNRDFAFDFVANRLPPPFHRTIPIGLDVEACTFAALERAWSEGREPRDREHVMPYLYEGVELSAVSPQLATGLSGHGFRVALINSVPDLGSYRWTVDTPEDLELIRRVYARFGGRDDFSWKELLDLVQREPQLMEINAGVPHKTLSDVDDRALKR